MRKNWIVGGLLLVLVYCASEKQPVSHISIAYPSLVSNLDPISENTVISNAIYCNIFETLVKRDHNMRIVPGLGTDWSNPDDRTCIIKLRPGVRFHNGKLLRPEDVRFSINRARKEPSSQLSSLLTMLESVDVIASDSIRLVTRKPYNIILNRLADIWIMAEEKSPDFYSGTGPYWLKEWKKTEFVLLERNDNYWGSKPAIQQIRFEAIPDLQKRILGLTQGSIDILPLLEPSALGHELIKRDEKTTVQSVPGMMVLYLAMDVWREKTPYVNLPVNPFRDIRVRKAIYHAINTKRIVRGVLQGHAREATQLVAPKVFGHNDRIERLPYDPQAARKLLKQAGYSKGFPVRLDITNNRYRDDLEVGRSIVRDLAEVGIDVQLNDMDKNLLFQKRISRDTSFYMLGWFDSSADSGGAFDFLIHTPDASRAYGIGNGGGYSNKEVDRLIERSSEEMSPSNRGALLEKVMEQIMKDLPLIPLHIENNITATSSRIQWQPRSDELLIVSEIGFR